MNSFVRDFQAEWHKPGNGLVRIIIVNAFVWVILGIFEVIAKMSGAGLFYTEASAFLFIPADALDFVFKPWTIVTYFFVHEQFFHILFNMLVLYSFGIIIRDYLGSRKVVAVYFLGGLAGGIIYLIFFNTIPYFMAMPASHMLGASGAVYAVVVAAATMVPDLRMNLLFIGPVKIKYIAAVYVLLSFFNLVSDNAGGNLAHIGGAATGYFFIVRFKKGDDWSITILKVLDWFEALFTRKPKMKVTYGSGVKNPAPKFAGRSSAAKGQPTQQAGDDVRQEVVDAILDKISQAGYEKLTQEEKQILFKFSQKK